MSPQQLLLGVSICFKHFHTVASHPEARKKAPKQMGCLVGQSAVARARCFDLPFWIEEWRKAAIGRRNGVMQSVHA